MGARLTNRITLAMEAIEAGMAALLADRTLKAVRRGPIAEATEHNLPVLAMLPREARREGGEWYITIDLAIVAERGSLDLDDAGLTLVAYVVGAVDNLVAGGTLGAYADSPVWTLLGGIDRGGAGFEHAIAVGTLKLRVADPLYVIVDED